MKRTYVLILEIHFENKTIKYEDFKFLLFQYQLSGKYQH